ncbi:MAG: glycosyltransferase family 4 protein [Bryobacteraceae bacterium]
MKLGYLVSQYPAINHTFILREIQALRKRGFDISVISIRPADRAPAQLGLEEREEEVLTRSVKAASPFDVAAAHLAVLRARPVAYVRGIAASLRLGGWRPQTTLAHLFYFAEAVVAGHWMLLKGVRHFHVHFSSTVGLLMTTVFPLTMSITFHGPDEFSDLAGFHVAEKVSASSFACAISCYARSQLMRVCGFPQWSKIEVAKLGVDPSVFAPRPFRETPDPFEIVCVARLAPVKAQHILLDAIACLVHEGRRLKLHLVGDGDERARLEAHVARQALGDHVVFHGWLNQDRVLDLNGKADICALPSFAEGVPVVLMEAMAMEIPCVATFIAGVPELIEDRVSGLLVPASDTQRLASAIALLMDDPGLRRRIGAAGREKVLREFDLTKNTDLLAEIFRRRISSVGAAPQMGS